MKLSVLAILATCSVAALAAPAAAQPPYGGYGGYGPRHEEGGGWDLDRRIDWLQDRITRGRDDGSLSPEEAGRVQHRLNDIRHDMHRMRDRDGGYLTPHDRDVLDERLDRLNDEIHWLRHNDEHRPW
jgi:hypothetical protein